MIVGFWLVERRNRRVEFSASHGRVSRDQASGRTPSKSPSECCKMFEKLPENFPLMVKLRMHKNESVVLVLPSSSNVQNLEELFLIK